MYFGFFLFIHFGNVYSGNLKLINEILVGIY